MDVGYWRSQWQRNYCNVLRKELQKTNEKEFRIKQVIKRKGNKLYVKWKGYDNSFNSQIDKKYIVIQKLVTKNKINVLL